MKIDKIDGTIASVREQLDANRESWLKEIEDRKASRMLRLEENRQRKERQAHILEEMERYFGLANRKQIRITKNDENFNCIEMINEPDSPSDGRKKQDEKRAVLSVLKLMGIQDFSIVLQESPDILVRCADGNKIGIEVTKCCPSLIDNSGNALKAVTLKKHIIDNYKRLLLERGENHSIVCVLFNDRIYGLHSGPDKTIIKNAVEEIDRFRNNERILSAPERLINGTEAFHKWSALLRSADLNYNYVDNVTVMKSDDFLTNVYEDFEVRFASDIQPYHLQDRIDDKECKLQDYKMNPKNNDINEYWLVIPIPSIETFDLNDGIDYSGLKTSFDKVFVNGFSKTIQIK